MRVTCHIGHHKTGTTSLQAYLSQNSNALLRAGILYPWVESQGAALSMAKAASARDPQRRFGLTRKLIEGFSGDKAGVLPINFREAHNALAFRMLADAKDQWRVPPYHRELPASRQMLIAIRNQLEHLEPSEIVLCSEVMSHFGKSAPDLIDKLRQSLARAKDFTVWCTLRRPDQQAASWHGQQIKFGQAPKALSDPDGIDYSWLHFDYLGVIQPWIDRIPEAKLMLRPYDVVMSEGGSVDDLLKNAGISFPEGMIMAPTMNVSQPAAVSGLMRLANGALPAELAREFDKQISPVARNVRQPNSKQVEFFGQANRDQMMARFAPIHEALGRLSGRNTFFSDLDDMATCKPIPEKEAIRELLDGLSGHVSALTRPELQTFLKELIKTYGRSDQAA